MALVVLPWMLAKGVSKAVGQWLCIGTLGFALHGVLLSLTRLLSGWVGCCLPVPRHRSVLVVVVVQVTGTTEASTAAQQHEALQRQETYQEGGALLEGGAVEVGERSDLTLSPTAYLSRYLPRIFTGEFVIVLKCPLFGQMSIF